MEEERRTGFLVNYLPDLLPSSPRKYYNYQILAVSKKLTSSEEKMFIPLEAAKKILKKRETLETGIITFNPDWAVDGRWQSAFNPFVNLSSWQKRKITRKKVASRVELAVLEHLERIGFNGEIKRETFSSSRIKMLEATGRHAFGVYRPKYEIAEIRKSLEPKPPPERRGAIRNLVNFGLKLFGKK
jgi:hypothetical protein